MHPALTFNDMFEKLGKRNKNNKALFGILLAQPNSSFVQENIISRIQYYSTRSYDNIDFYFPGYGQYWNHQYCKKYDIVARVDRSDWLYGDEKFVDFVNELEEISNYEYSGECELILLVYDNECIHFEKVIVFSLEKLLLDGRVTTIHRFFEDVFRIIKNSRCNPEFDMNFVDSELSQIMLNSKSDEKRRFKIESKCLEMYDYVKK